MQFNDTDDLPSSLKCVSQVFFHNFDIFPYEVTCLACLQVSYTRDDVLCTLCRVSCAFLQEPLVSARGENGTKVVATVSEGARVTTLPLTHYQRT